MRRYDTGRQEGKRQRLSRERVAEKGGRRERGLSVCAGAGITQSPSPVAAQ